MTKTGRERESLSLLETLLMPRVSTLFDIWREMGLPSDMQEERMTACYGHIETLITDMINEEKEHMAQLKDRIEEYQREIQSLQLELPDAEIEQEPASPVRSLCAQEVHLCRQVQALKQEKLARQNEWTRLVGEDKRLSALLHCDSYPMVGSAFLTTVPSWRKIGDLNARMNELSADLATKQQLLSEVSDMLKRLYRRTNYRPEDSLETALLNDSSKVALSRENCIKLVTLRPKFQALFDAFMANLKATIHQLRGELLLWEDKAKIAYAERFSVEDGEFTEEALDAYHKRIGELKQIYEKNSFVFDKVAQWEDAFRKLLENEERDKDPSRYYQMKGGALEASLKEAKATKKRFETLEQEFTSHAEQWSSVSVYGMTPLEYVKAQKDSYDTAKQREREQKMKQRVAANEKETKFGSKAVIGQKRPHLPTRAASVKTRKVDIVPPVAVGLVGHSPGTSTYSGRSRLGNQTNNVTLFGAPAIPDLKASTPVILVTNASISAAPHNGSDPTSVSSYSATSSAASNLIGQTAAAANGSANQNAAANGSANQNAASQLQRQKTFTIDGQKGCFGPKPDETLALSYEDFQKDLHSKKRADDVISTFLHP